MRRIARSQCRDTLRFALSQLNAVRFGGLLAAFVNGLYAIFVLWCYRDDPAAVTPCSNAFGMDLSGSASPLGSGSSAGETLQLVQDYAVFGGLVAVNVLAIVSGAAGSILVVTACPTLNRYACTFQGSYGTMSRRPNGSLQTRENSKISVT